MHTHLDPINTSTRREIYTVSQLNQTIRLWLENEYSLVWLEGEISNFNAHTSGHWYFSLKDQSAQIRCAMFRNRNQPLRQQPNNGMQVIVRGKLSLYELRGEYQLIVDYLEETGEGALRLAFEQLKQKLFTAGLFDAHHKKPLPLFPKNVGVITSAVGAALQDILTTLKRRFPALNIVIYPSEVQGKKAVPKIVEALTIAEQRRECEVLILARGGGSLEDLWCFNEEAVAYAIYQSTIPIVTGIGHEIDITIADLVADQRAATPTAAAELVSPNQQALQQQLLDISQRLSHTVQRYLHLAKQHFYQLSKRLQHPSRRLQDQMQRLDDTVNRYQQCMQHLLLKYTNRLHSLMNKLNQQHPQQRIRLAQQQTAYLNQRLRQSFFAYFSYQETKLEGLQQALNAVSPQATLARGYAIITTPEHTLVETSKQLKLGQQIVARLKEGIISAEVKKIE